MSTVGTSSFLEDGTKSYFTLFNEQYLRKMDYNYSWTQLQIGVLYAIEATASITGGLWIGLGSSAQGNIGFKNGTAALKRMVGGGTGRMWEIIGGNSIYSIITYNSDPVSGSYFSSPIVMTLAISGSAIVGSGGNPQTACVATTELPARKTISTVILTRTGNNVGAIKAAPVNYTSSANTNKNHTDHTLMASLHYNGAQCNGVNMSSVATATLTGTAHDDLYYPLDTINIFWTGSCPIRIYDIKVKVSS